MLAYNEPNQPDQADISPEDAAFHYAELAEKYKDKVFTNMISLLFSSQIDEKQLRNFQINSNSKNDFFRYLLAQQLVTWILIGWMSSWTLVSY